ncbi:MAG: hypothetical protein KGI41_01385, partial [Patescibacteria group bacterium]|nr:hypothetical protein [Patescibacteria group bacterium]
QKEKFVKGVVENGQTEHFAEKLWKLFEPFQAYGFNKCVTGDTRVIDGETGAPERIDALHARTRTPVVNALTATGKIVTAQALHVRKNGRKPVFRLETRSGRVVRATANHPLLAFGGWKRLDALAVGERIAVPRVLPPPVRTEPLATHEAALLGYLIAEGNLCHPSGVYYYAKAEDEVADFVHHASRFVNARITLDRSKSATSVYVGREHVREQNGLFEWLKELAMLGKKATEKSVPARVFRANDAAIALLLGKMWQGDGCVNPANTQTYYATSSRALADDVQHLLARLGIVSALHTKAFAYRGSHKRGYTVVVTGCANLETFAKTVGTHLLAAKRTALTETLARARVRANARGRGTADTVPADVFPLIRQAVLASGLSVDACAERADLSERSFGFDARKRGYTRSTLCAMGEALCAPELLRQARSDIFWDEVESITPDGREMTYDLTVPGHENFVANGIIVHNSHAASYGKVAYQTAYMKANFPVEYMAALLTADSGDTESIAILVGECERLGIPVLPPSVNESGTDFTIVSTAERGGGTRNAADGAATAVSEAIRFGLSTIKNFGVGISEAIIKEREKNGPFKNLADFLSRIDAKGLNRKGLEALAKCGALDAFSERGAILANIETLLSFHKDATATASQDSLFSSGGGALLDTPEIRLVPADPVSLLDKLAWEKELLGIYVSGHPLDAHAELLKRTRIGIKELHEDPRPGITLILPALVTEARTILTKGGEKMAFLKLEDKRASIEAVAFPKLFKKHAALLAPGACILAKAKVANRNGELSLALEDVKAL